MTALSTASLLLLVGLLVPLGSAEVPRQAEICHLAEVHTRPPTVIVDPHGCYEDFVNEVYHDVLEVIDFLCVHGSEPWCNLPPA